jgi:hypothetical protein
LRPDPVGHKAPPSTGKGLLQVLFLMNRNDIGKKRIELTKERIGFFKNCHFIVFVRNYKTGNIAR